MNATSQLACLLAGPRSGCGSPGPGAMGSPSGFWGHAGPCVHIGAVGVGDPGHCPGQGKEGCPHTCSLFPHPVLLLKWLLFYILQMS